MIYTKLSTLRALANLAAEKDIRYYLCGLLIEANTEQTRVVATNGHVMGVMNNNARDLGEQGNEITSPVSFIIPIDAIKMLKPAGNKLDQVSITIERDGSGLVLRGVINVLGGASVNFTAVDGKFPDYVRVIPDKVTGEVAQFNPDYIADFKKAYKLLGAKTFHIHHNGHGGAIVDFARDDFLGIMMPLRTGAEGLTYNPSQFKKAV